MASVREVQHHNEVNFPTCLTKVTRAFISLQHGGVGESVSVIVTQALSASLTNYRRGAGTELLRSLVQIAHRSQAQTQQGDKCAANAGAVRIANWLGSHFAPESSPINSKKNNNAPAGLLEQSVGTQELSLLLGDLSREVGLLDDEEKGPYLLIQLVLLLRVLASAEDVRTANGLPGIHLQSLYFLLEDQSPARDISSHSFNKLEQVRFDVSSLASLKNKRGVALLQDLLPPHSNTLTVPIVMDLLSRVSPAAVAPEASSTDIDLLNTSANSTVDSTYLCEFIVEMAGMIGVNNSSHMSRECSLGQLGTLLSQDTDITTEKTFAAYGTRLQQKLQTWLRLPSLGQTFFDNLLDAFSALSLQGTLGGGFAEEGVRAMLASGVSDVEIPLSSPEARWMAHLVVNAGRGTDMGKVTNLLTKIREGQWIR